MAEGPAPATGDHPASSGRLTLIGTGHVFAIGQLVRDAVQALRPQVVFVELDKGRYQALAARRDGHAPPARGGFIHKRLQKFQEDVAGMYGAQIGEEMLAAVDGARSAGAEVRLIDPPAEETLRRALKAFTWRERLRVVTLLAKGGFDQLVPSRRKSRSIEDEVRRYEHDPQAALDELRAQFPSVYRVVIEERDELMARRIMEGLRGREGVAVVGDGHVPGLLQRLQGDVQTYRLADVRQGRLPKPGNDSWSFGFSAQVS